MTETWIEQQFARNKPALEANLTAFRAGWAFGETTELIDVQIRVPAATDIAPGTYRTVNGTTATALGLVAASVRSGLPLVFASYPITPASELLHELAAPSRRRACARSRPRTRSPRRAWRSAPRSAARSASRRRAAPGMDLKAETIGLAVMLELPMLIIDVQRAGPSTGMPTKTEQSDLLMALLRSPRRVAAADRLRDDARAVLRRDARSGADRDSLPHAGDPPHRPLPRELLGAVDASRTSRSCRRSTRTSRRSTAAARSRPTRATPTARVRGRCRERPG